MIDYLKDVTDLSPYINTKPFCAVRVNPLRLSADEFEKIAPFELKKCPFHKHGYYISDEDKSGKHPLHYAGAYYIQEPSAMSAVTALDVNENDIVLDACAAPGSKSTAIAPHCKLLVANEINKTRVTALIGNIERMGISNALVLCSDTQAVANAFAGYFDKVLVDTPCSGEGMFRKHPEILENWNKELVRMCAERSYSVLENAARTLKAGGRLVYSTCTYNLEENEKVILKFLQNHSEFEIADTGLDFGRQGFLGLDKARRITIADGGEGHFVCALKKNECTEQSYVKPFSLKNKFQITEDIADIPQGYGIMEFQGTHYAVPFGMPNPKGVRVMRAGVRLGGYSGKLWKPEHHLFTAFKAKRSIPLDQKTAECFLRGEQIPCDSAVSGYCAVTYHGMPLGFGKASGGVCKNHLPKGLRVLK